MPRNPYHLTALKPSEAPAVARASEQKLLEVDPVNVFKITTVRITSLLQSLYYNSFALWFPLFSQDEWKNGVLVVLKICL